jgi:hypothetical protein
MAIFEQPKGPYMKVISKWKIIIALLLLNLLGFLAAQTYFSKHAAGNSEIETLETKPRFGANVKDAGVYAKWGVRLLTLVFGQ